MDNEESYKEIKTLQDAIDKLGSENKAVKQYQSMCGIDIDGVDKDVLAYWRLRIVAKALNDGWEANFSDIRQHKYWPWFSLYTQEEWKNMSEPLRKYGAFIGDTNRIADYSYFLFAGTTYTQFVAYAGNGSQICFKNKELAEYAGKHFVDIYFDFLIGDAHYEKR